MYTDDLHRERCPRECDRFSLFVLLLNERLIEKIKTIELILVAWEWRSNGG